MKYIYETYGQIIAKYIVLGQQIQVICEFEKKIYE